MFGKRSWGTPSPATHVCSGSCWKTLRELGFMRGKRFRGLEKRQGPDPPQLQGSLPPWGQRNPWMWTPPPRRVTVQRSSCWTPGRQREEVKLAAREGWMVSGPPGRLGEGPGRSGRCGAQAELGRPLLDAGETAGGAGRDPATQRPHQDGTLMPKCLRSCSRNTKVSTVWGMRRMPAGTRPL